MESVCYCRRNIRISEKEKIIDYINKWREIWDNFLCVFLHMFFLSVLELIEDPNLIIQEKNHGDFGFWYLRTFGIMVFLGKEESSLLSSVFEASQTKKS